MQPHNGAAIQATFGWFEIENFAHPGIVDHCQAALGKDAGFE